MGKSRTRLLAAGGIILCLAAFYFGYGTGSRWVDFCFRLLTFTLFIALIWLAAGDRVKGFLNGRSERIAAELANLEKAKVQASRRLKEVEAKIVNLDKERQALLIAYKAQGEALKSEIIVKAEKNARQIIAQAKLTAQNEVDKAMQDMRSEIAEEIFSTAESLLRKKLDGQAHEKLMDKSLSKVVLN
ncbi:MAG: ATP synthase F0 subunit B [Desulfovibrionaceae bacterium]|nr:ATP synthase F0 subunit B [Desulfovibrionaceae bacterium]